MSEKVRHNCAYPFLVDEFDREYRARSKAEAGGVDGSDLNHEQYQANDEAVRAYREYLEARVKRAKEK